MIWYIVFGLVAGAANGLLVRVVMRKYLSSPDSKFYKVWISGMLYKILFAALAVYLMIGKGPLAMVVFMAAFIAAQTCAQIVAVKN